MNAVTSPGQRTQRLFIYRDFISGISFLIDTGAAVSVYPASGPDVTATPSTSILVAANGTPIETFGEQSLPVTMGQLKISWPFLLARVTRAILDANFLHHTGFLVDVKWKRLVRPEAWDTAQLQTAQETADNVYFLQKPDNK